MKIAIFSISAHVRHTLKIFLHIRGLLHFFFLRQKSYDSEEKLAQIFAGLIYRVKKFRFLQTHIHFNHIRRKTVLNFVTWHSHSFVYKWYLSISYLNTHIFISSFFRKINILMSDFATVKSLLLLIEQPSYISIFI